MESPEERDDIELDETGQAWEDLIDEQEAEKLLNKAKEKVNPDRSDENEQR